MEKSLNSEVLSKVDEIVSYLKESPSYQKYQVITEKMKNNSDITNKIMKIKKLQKEVVKLEYNKKDTSLKEKEISNLLEELNTYPIYQEYNYLLEDLNATFQEIKFIIENYLNTKIN